MKKIVGALVAIILVIFIAVPFFSSKEIWDGAFYQYKDDNHALIFEFETMGQSGNLYVKKIEIDTSNGFNSSRVNFMAELTKKNRAENNSEFIFTLKGDNLTVVLAKNVDPSQYIGTDFTGVYKRGASVEATFELYEDEPNTYEIKTAILIADFGLNIDGPVFEELEWDYVAPLTISTLAQGMTELFGLDFSIASEIHENKAYVTWFNDSTLIAGLNDRDQKEDYFFYDIISLNCFMMDSLASTIIRNFDQVTEVYYAGENGESLIFTNMDDMESQGLANLPVDEPYLGSAHYKSQR